MSKFDLSHRAVLVASGVLLAASVLFGAGCSADDDEGGGPVPTKDGSVQDSGKDATAPDRGASEAATDARRDQVVSEGSRPDAADGPSCSDGAKNGSETDVDCGGSCATKCELGKACGANEDCKSTICSQNVCVQCIEANTCPGTDTDCQVRTCYGNSCGISNIPANTRLTMQTAGDCKARVCDGNGAISVVNDDTDVAVDGKQCTRDLCTAGSPSNPPVTAGTLCTESGGKVCDGSGACVGCNAPADCGPNTDCRTYTCSNHVCGVVNAPSTKPISDQVAGDCKKVFCDGMGGVAVPVADDSDKPDDDGRECTDDVCMNGTPSHPPVAANTSCANGTATCNAGKCGECDFPIDCSNTTDTACHHRTCTSHTCGVFNEVAGTAPKQTAGDCHIIHCDGSGNATEDVDDTDKPVDNNDCTSDICTNGVASNPPLTAGTVCTKAQGGRCASGGTCVPTFMVVRVGTGMAALSNASTAAFVERRYFDSTAAVVSTIALPTEASGTNKPLTLSGTTTREGFIQLSANGRFASMLGYGAAPGTGSISSSAAGTVNRVIGRIDSSDGVDTSTALTSAYSGNNARGAVTVDGTAFWTAGADTTSGPTGGVWYIGLGQMGGTQVVAEPHSWRSAFIFDGRLYGGSADATPTDFRGIFVVASLPTAPATATLLPGIPNTVSPAQFILFDRDPAVAGPDTLYVADERSTANGGGLLKFTFNGTTWSPSATPLITGAMRGVAGMITGNTVTLLAVTDGSQNRVLMYVDDGTSQTPAVLSTAVANSVYRSLSLAP